MNKHPITAEEIQGMSEDLEIAEKIQQRAIELIGEGEDPADVIHSVLMAGLSLARIWMPFEDIAMYLRTLADNAEEAGGISATKN